MRIRGQGLIGSLREVLSQEVGGSVTDRRQVSMTAGTDHPENVRSVGPERYGELRVGSDELVIYDRDNHEAWIQSDVVVRLD